MNFSTAPILRHPDPNVPFSVEVDTSNTGIGGRAVPILWGASSSPALRILFKETDPSGAELRHRQPGVTGHQTCLGRVVALAARSESSIHRDHKNLRDAKRLNPLQARWELFFARFNFTITYCPGNCNNKANALSRIHSPDSPYDPEQILRPDLIVSPLQWNIDEDI